MSYFKSVLAAAPFVLIGALIAANVPEIMRYLKIRSHTRSELPMGVTHTPRSYVVGRQHV